jgi:hypothetical protein
MTSALPMTPPRWVALALGVPVALALIGWTSFTAIAMADTAGYRVHLSVPVSGAQARVTIDNADATVRPGAGRRTWISGTLRGSLARPTFTWRSTDAGLSLRSRCWAWAGLCSLRYQITAPAGLPLAVSDGSGDLNASGFRGHVTLADDSGDLTASRLTGALSLSNGSGDIAAHGLRGDGVRLSDGSGNITASGLGGSGVRLSNGSGDIVVTGLAVTDVAAHDASGNITLVFTTVPRRVDVTDESGDITLVLPRGPAYQVQAGSSTGTTSVSVNRSPSSPYVITANNVSGNVSISY